MPKSGKKPPFMMAKRGAAPGKPPAAMAAAGPPAGPPPAPMFKKGGKVKKGKK